MKPALPVPEFRVKNFVLSANLDLKLNAKPALPVPEFRVKNFVLSAKLYLKLLFLEQVTADARKALFEELLWEHRELAEAHDKCQGNFVRPASFYKASS